MIPKKIYLNYVEEEDFDNGAEITWCVDPVSVADCEMQNREYIDLSQTWHPAEEEPTKEQPVLYVTKNGKIAVLNKVHAGNWDWYVDKYSIILWCYTEDVLPKQD